MTPQSTELCSLYLKLDELNHEWLGLIIEYLDNMLQKQSNEVIKTKMSTKTQEIKQIIDIIGLLKNRL